VLIGMVADAHCNVATLQVAIDRLAPVVDEVLFAGDAVYGYRMCVETVDAVRRSGMRCILGNHDLELLGPGGERARAATGMRPELFGFLRDLPTTLDTTVGGKHLRMVHGSPWAPHNEYVMPGGPLLAKCGGLGVDILVLGHTHVPMVERVGRTLVINPGSVGESRERGAGDMVSYAILDTASEEVELLRFENPRFVRADPAAVSGRLDTP
jgi:putative phosphoesterase